MEKIEFFMIWGLIGWIYGLIAFWRCMVLGKKVIKKNEKIILLNKQYAHSVMTLWETREEIKKCNKKWWD